MRYRLVSYRQYFDDLEAITDMARKIYGLDSKSSTFKHVQDNIMILCERLSIKNTEELHKKILKTKLEAMEKFRRGDFSGAYYVLGRTIDLLSFESDNPNAQSIINNTRDYLSKKRDILMNFINFDI